MLPAAAAAAAEVTAASQLVSIVGAKILQLTDSLSGTRLGGFHVSLRVFSKGEICEGRGFADRRNACGSPSAFRVESPFRPLPTLTPA